MEGQKMHASTMNVATKRGEGIQRLFCFCVIALFIIQGAPRAQSQTETARKLSNPVGYISLPFQNNFESGIHPNNGFKWTMNFQPILPFSLSSDWNVINRLSIPVVSQRHIIGNTSQAGVGDAVVNVLFSPKDAGIIWGIGPAFFIPSGSSQFLTSKKWGIGPDILGIVRAGALTVGALYFHVWSIAGDEKRPDLSFSYLQPWVNYAMKDGWGIGAVSEMIDEMKRKSTNGSVIFTVSKLMPIGGRPVQFVAGPKLYFGNFNRPALGVRATVVFLFPDF